MKQEQNQTYQISSQNQVEGGKALKMMQLQNTHQNDSFLLVVAESFGSLRAMRWAKYSEGHHKN